MTAPNLEAAIALQNSVDYGLTAGLHSLSADEINLWLSKVEAGNVYVNRGITGAIVRRQAFGGWKKSAVGPTAKAGGPNYLFCLTDWKITSNNAKEPVGSKVIDQLLVMATATTMSDSDLQSLLRAAQSDVAATRHYFNTGTIDSNLKSEINLLRYMRSDCTVRIQPDASEYDCWRSAITLLAVGKGEVSAEHLPQRLANYLTENGIVVKLESEAEWLRSLARPRRVRVYGTVDLRSAELANPDIAIYISGPTESGIIDLLPFFKEQAVSITAHRFGNPARHLALVRL
jgi:RHH-type proline utilization regulon transcriptional repressor/proline dehydrogenase/delta 1-pyrroline-5-carboxylate dehydrogenase